MRVGAHRSVAVTVGRSESRVTAQSRRIDTISLGGMGNRSAVTTAVTTGVSAGITTAITAGTRVVHFARGHVRVTEPERNVRSEFHSQGMPVIYPYP